jgi:oxalate decarboxylase
MDFHAGSVVHIEQSLPGYIENTGDMDLMFLEVCPTADYRDISLAEWLAHPPVVTCGSTHRDWRRLCAQDC